MSKVMSTDELAAYLRMNPATIRRNVERGEIPAIRIGRSWRFPKAMIDQWLTESMEVIKDET